MASSVNSGTVRMGPISIFALIILICLAVMAVLTISTAQATYSAAEKQMLFTDDTYENERAGQELVKLVDETLAPLRTSGGTVGGAVAALEEVLPEGAFVEDSSVYARFVADSGRALTVTIAIRDDLDYSITNWQASTQWTEDPSSGNENLWTGNS